MSTAEAAVSQAGAGPDEPVVYIGLATRVVSFVIDAALLNLVSLLVSVAVALTLSVLHLPHEVNALIAAAGGVIYILWILLYFVVFWATTGQTPGARVMQIRVVSIRSDRVKPRTALLRCGGVVLAAIPLFAGFILILFDSRRRGFQDRLAGTLVIDARQQSLAEIARLRRRAPASGAPPANGAPDQPSAEPGSRH